MRGTNITCDSCGEVVFGKKGIAWVQKDHIAIMGKASIQMPEIQDYVWITKDAETEMHFCDNNECLPTYLSYRRYTHLRHRNERETAIKKREAENAH